MKKENHEKVKISKNKYHFYVCDDGYCGFFGCSTSMEYINQGDVVEGKHYELVIDKIK